jgi:hypothetical protein
LITTANSSTPLAWMTADYASTVLCCFHSQQRTCPATVFSSSSCVNGQFHIQAAITCATRSSRVAKASVGWSWEPCQAAWGLIRRSQRRRRWECRPRPSKVDVERMGKSSAEEDWSPSSHRRIAAPHLQSKTLLVEAKSMGACGTGLV